MPIKFGTREVAAVYFGTQLVTKTFFGSAESGTTTGPTTPTLSSAPQNLTATPANVSVVLQWSLPANTGDTVINNYVVQYSSSGGASWTEFPRIPSTATQATVTGLVNGTNYLFRVAAITVAGTGDFATTTQPVAPRTLPAAPTNVVGTAAGSGSILLTWTVPTSNGGAEITDYRIEYTTNNGLSWLLYSDSVSPVLNAVIAVTNNIAYRFRVAAINPAGTGPNSASSAAVTTTQVTGTLQLTAQPQSVEVDNGLSVTLSAAAQFSANSPSAAISPTIYYTWFRNGVSLGARTQNTVTYTATSLVAGSYYVQVTAAGAAPVTSNTVTLGVRTRPTTAPVFTVLTATSSSIIVAWDPPTGTGNLPITSYRLEYTNNIGLVNSWRAVTTPNTTFTLTAPTITNGQTYFFRIAASNRLGLGVYSSGSPSVTPAGPPSIVRSLTTRAGNESVTLNWVAPAQNGGSPILYYRVGYAVSGTNLWTLFSNNIPCCTATVDSLVNGVPYVFRVAALNSAGASTLVYTAAVTPRTQPEAPLNVTAAARNAAALISWSKPANNGARISQYTIRYATNNAPFIVAGNIFVATADSRTEFSLFVPRLRNGVVHSFYVTARNVAGESVFSVPAVVTPSA